MFQRRARAGLLLLVALSFTTAIPAAAQRVTLTLRDAELSQVLTELRAQSGFDIQYAMPPDDRARPRRHSFSWKEAPLKEALRQVGVAYGYTFRRNSPTSFWGDPGAPPAEGRLPGVSIGDLKLYVDRLTISEMRSLHLGTGESSATQSFTLELVAEGPTEESVDLIYGFETAVEAVDDQGNRLVSEVRGFNSGTGSRYPSPDQWRQYLTLPAPGPRAKKLVALTGELVLYREVRTTRVEIPLPLSQRPFTRQVGDVTLTVTEARSRSSDFTVRTTVSWPGVAGGEQERTIRPLLVLASGHGRRPNGMNVTPVNAPQALGGADTSPEPFRSEQHLTFAGVREPATKLVFDIATRLNPDRRVRYRITDIPLPPPIAPSRPPAARRAVPRAVSGVTEIGAETPFYDARGGTLVARVPGAPRGTRLSLGLSRRDGASWSPWRWTDVTLSPDGAARLGPLRPGTYRLRHSLTRPDGSALPSAANPTTVQVVHGREVSVGLRWD